MPTYDYVCDACSHAFDEFQSINDKPLKKCPKCGKSKLRRLFGTGAGILFKGSGFYSTDYRSQSYKQAAQAEQNRASSSGDAASTTGKTDTGSQGKAADSGNSSAKKAK